MVLSIELVVFSTSSSAQILKYQYVALGFSRFSRDLVEGGSGFGSGESMVNHYYIYAVDDDFGPFFLKFLQLLSL